MNTCDDIDVDSPLMRLFRMCDDKQKPEFEPIRRSVRIHGHATTIRLEKAFWNVVEDIAREQGVSVSQLITTIHDKCPDVDRQNLASCLRVACLKYMSFQM